MGWVTGVLQVCYRCVASVLQGCNTEWCCVVLQEPDRVGGSHRQRYLRSVSKLVRRVALHVSVAMVVVVVVVVVCVAAVQGGEWLLVSVACLCCRVRVSAVNSVGGSRWAEVGVHATRPAPPLVPVVVVHDSQGRRPLYEVRWHTHLDAHHTVYLCVGEQEGAHPCTVSVCVCVCVCLCLYNCMSVYLCTCVCIPVVHIYFIHLNTLPPPSRASWPGPRCPTPPPPTSRCRTSV